MKGCLIVSGVAGALLLATCAYFLLRQDLAYERFNFSSSHAEANEGMEVSLSLRGTWKVVSEESDYPQVSHLASPYDGFVSLRSDRPFSGDVKITLVKLVQIDSGDLLIENIVSDEFTDRNRQWTDGSYVHSLRISDLDLPHAPLEAEVKIEFFTDEGEVLTETLRIEMTPELKKETGNRIWSGIMSV